MGDATVFSDGGCIGNPGPGGWAAIVLVAGVYREFGGFDPQTTNNRMELTAAIEGLSRVPEGSRVKVVTDSRYLIDGATKWLKGWRARGWVKADGDPVLNRDLWERVSLLQASRRVAWDHVRGHKGHPENERCDEIANRFARRAPPQLREGDGSWISRSARHKPPTDKPLTREVRKSPARESKPSGLEGAEVKYPSPLYLSIVAGDVREHGNWSECEARIKGVKGAKCRKVTSRAEHIAALFAWKDEE